MGSSKKEQERLAEEHFTATRELIESVKGIGPRTTCALLAYAGDLSSFDSHKELAAFIGLNPVVSQSGQREKQAHISKQGHAKLRTLFYMGAQTARLYNNTCRRLCDRLIQRGKAKKVALIAGPTSWLIECSRWSKVRRFSTTTTRKNRSLLETPKHSSSQAKRRDLDEHRTA